MTSNENDQPKRRAGSHLPPARQERFSNPELAAMPQIVAATLLAPVEVA
jgi:hypothetical protein